jgi:hypothetical protein
VHRAVLASFLTAWDDTGGMIPLSDSARERVEAFVDARLDGPLFALDIADSFSPEIAAAWIYAQVSDPHPAYRVVDAHLEDGMGALITAAYPSVPRTDWDEIVAVNSDMGLYRLALEWRNGTTYLGEGSVTTDSESL